MNKVFNASLIAASLAMAFAANAADLTIASPTVITTEAAAAGVAATAGAQTIRVITRSELVPGDKITLTFPIGTTFTPAGDGATGAAGGNADFEIVYGNGTFRFANVTWSAGTATVAPTLKMDVELGNPVIANSAYDIVFKDTTFVPKAGNVTYSAVDGISGVAKDTAGNNLAPLTKTAAQEVATIEKKFDGFINRTNRNQFVANKGTTVAELKVSQPSNGVAGDVVATVASEQVVLKAASGLGKLTSVTLSTCADTTVADGAACAGGNPATAVRVDVPAAAFSCSTVGGTCKDTATFDSSTLAAVLPAATGTATGVVGTWYVGVTPGGSTGDTLPVTSFELTRKVTYTGVATAYTYVSGDAGKFQLDATVVNVPYLPVGYAHLSPVVEISNVGSTDAEVIVEAVGKTGVKYGPVTLTTKPAKKGAVTSIFETDLLSAFNLTKGVSNEKLSVTFIINADASNISLAPYYTNSTLGTTINVVNDQYKK